MCTCYFRDTFCIQSVLLQVHFLYTERLTDLLVHCMCYHHNVRFISGLLSECASYSISVKCAVRDAEDLRCGEFVARWKIPQFTMYTCVRAVKGVVQGGH